jgi:hypothetical protein
MTRVLEINDHSGLIGIVNSDCYDSYLKEDWELDELLERFKSEMNNCNCLVWATGTQDFFTLEFRKEKSSKVSNREVVANINVTNGKVFVTNYEDLTMAAQYEDETIPSKYNADKYIELANGSYTFCIRQMFDSTNYDIDNPPRPFYEIVISKQDQPKENNMQNVIWWQD